MKNKPLGYSDLSELCMELHLIVKAGISLSEGIELLLEDTKGKSESLLKQTLTKLHTSSKEYKTITDKFRDAGVFPPYFLSMIEVGETTGNLDAVFRSLSVYYDRRLAISQSVRSMILFPCILFATMVSIVVVLITYVLPIFQGVFAQLGVSLSATATWLLGIGDFLHTARFVFLGLLATMLIALIAVLVIPALRSKAAQTIDRIFAKTKLGQEISGAHFVAAMSMSISSGVDIDASLLMAENIVPGTEISKKSEKCRKLLAEGAMFYSAVLDIQLFEPVYCRMLSVGIKTGSTDNVMEDIAKRSEEKANQSMESTIAKVEPCLVVVMSLMVGFILLSVMLPLMGIMSSIG